MAFKTFSYVAPIYFSMWPHLFFNLKTCTHFFFHMHLSSREFMSSKVGLIWSPPYPHAYQEFRSKFLPQRKSKSEHHG